MSRSPVVALKSRIVWRGSSIGICACGSTMRTRFFFATPRTVSQIRPLRARPLFASALSYSSFAATIGRSRSTPLSLPMYFAFNTSQRAYSSAGRICCSVSPSSFLRAP
jgi:hypothetical protein